jgi:hypothetical protein
VGLDNIPAEYPCIAEGFQPEGKQINCDKMIERNMCPWNKVLGEEKGSISGMFGTYCWYRGKAGNYMLEKLSEHVEDEPPTTFYGDDELEDGSEGISPEACLNLASWMADNSELYASIAGSEYSSLEDEIDSYKYAINWLKFVSEYGGTKVWY